MARNMRLRRILPLFLAAAACAADSPDPACPGVYLAFDGATLDAVGAGKDDAVAGQSSLIDGPVTFPPFLAGRPDRDAVIAQITDDVALALEPVGVNVVTEPPAGDHILVVFAGIDRGVLVGLTRQDCGDLIANDVMIRFEGVVAPEYGRFSAANEVMFGLSEAVGLGKSYSEDSHPCSCDPSNCDNDTLCELSAAAEVVFAPCTHVGDVQDEVDAFEHSFACSAD